MDMQEALVELNSKLTQRLGGESEFAAMFGLVSAMDQSLELTNRRFDPEFLENIVVKTVSELDEDDIVCGPCEAAALEHAVKYVEERNLFECRYHN